MKYNASKVEKIVFGGKPTYSSGGIEPFSHLHPSKLKQLVEEGLVDPDGSQNDSPTTQEFLEFGEQFPFVRYIGYAVSPKRPDTRLTIEGIVVSETNVPEEALRSFRKAFKKFCHAADELDLPYENYKFYRAWWD